MKTPKLTGRYYKVLIQYHDHFRKGPQPITGGNTYFNYKKYLPGHGHPGKWLKIPPKTRLMMCQDGFHVTNVPENWGATYSTCYGVYRVEIKGDFLRSRNYDGDYSDKVCCRQIRLLYKVVKHGKTWVKTRKR